MTFKYSFYLFLVSGLLFFTSCKNEVEKTDENPLEKQIALVKDEFAPDKRVALFDIKSVKIKNQLILKGASNLPEAVNLLKTNLKKADISVVDSIQMYPDAKLKGKTKAIVKISVANLRSNPAHSAELSTQATLGTPLNVYTKKDNWYLVQTPDKYLAWVDSGGIQLMENDQFATWKLADKIIFGSESESINAIDNDADVNEYDKYGFRPLIQAIICKKPKVLKYAAGFSLCTTCLCKISCVF